MAEAEPAVGKDSGLVGERRVYMPVSGWQGCELPPDIDRIITMPGWWMGFRRIDKEQDNGTQVQKCE